MDHAITGNMAYLLAVMKAVKRFKRAIREKRGRIKEGIFGKDSKIVSPPGAIGDSQNEAMPDRKLIEEALAAEGFPISLAAREDPKQLAHDMELLGIHESPVDGALKTGIEQIINAAVVTESIRRPPYASSSKSVDDSEASSLHSAGTANKRRSRTFPVEEPRKGQGQARDPLTEHVYLNLGANPDDDSAGTDYPMVMESPSAVDDNIYEQAYQDEMDRILERQGESASMYMNRRIEHRDDIRRRDQIKDAGKWAYKRAGEKYGEFYNKAQSANRMYQEEGGRYAARHAANKVATATSWLTKSGSTSDSTESAGQTTKSGAQDSADADQPPADSSQAKGYSAKFAWLSSKAGEAGSSLYKRAQDAAGAVRGQNQDNSETRLRAGDRLARGTLRPPKADGEARKSSRSPSANLTAEGNLAVPGPFPLAPEPTEKPQE